MRLITFLPYTRTEFSQRLFNQLKIKFHYNIWFGVDRLLHDLRWDTRPVEGKEVHGHAGPVELGHSLRRHPIGQVSAVQRRRRTESQRSLHCNQRWKGTEVILVLIFIHHFSVKCAIMAVKKNVFSNFSLKTD